MSKVLPRKEPKRGIQILHTQEVEGYDVVVVKYNDEIFMLSDFESCVKVSR